MNVIPLPSFIPLQFALAPMRVVPIWIKHPFDMPGSALASYDDDRR
jgi:hypothetical protein